MSKPVLVVTGDSFQTDDPNYPGQHWSEKLHNDFEVVNLAVAGASNTCISDQVLFALDNYNPLYMFIGFTTAGRFEYKFVPDTSKQKTTHIWHTNCETEKQTKEQKLLEMSMYDLLDFNAWMLRESLIVAKILDIVKNNKIKYAWSPCGFRFDIDTSVSPDQVYARTHHEQRWNTILDPVHTNQKILLDQIMYWIKNYSNDKKTVMSLPLFHIDHEEFHADFAYQVKNILLSA